MVEILENVAWFKNRGHPSWPIQLWNIGACWSYRECVTVLCFSITITRSTPSCKRELGNFPDNTLTGGIQKSLKLLTNLECTAGMNSPLDSLLGIKTTWCMMVVVPLAEPLNIRFHLAFQYGNLNKATPILKWCQTSSLRSNYYCVFLFSLTSVFPSFFLEYESWHD